MTHVDPLPLLSQYRAGLDAELALLHRLEAVAARQRDSTAAGDSDAVEAVTDQRERLMANLVVIEHELRPVRMALLEHRAALEGHDAFAAVAALHQHAAGLVATIIASDRESMAALQQAEIARRFAARSVEQGETTLAAYRRVIAPPLTGATLVDRKG